MEIMTIGICDFCGELTEIEHVRNFKVCKKRECRDKAYEILVGDLI